MEEFWMYVHPVPQSNMLVIIGPVYSFLGTILGAGLEK